MEWWAATIVVLALACAAIRRRSGVFAFAALAAFMPLALHTVFNDFDRFWLLMVLTFLVEAVAIARLRPLRGRGADHEGAAAPVVSEAAV